MLAIRMQRTGRKGHAMFRVVVQDSRRTPTSGNIVALLGSYDPHAKLLALNKEKASFYLEHGAQPSERAARLLKIEGLKLPKWALDSGDKSGKLRNPDKLRRNRPPEEKAPATSAPESELEAAPTETEAVETQEQAEAADTNEVVEESTATPAETPAEEPVEPESSATETSAETDEESSAKDNKAEA